MDLFPLRFWITWTSFSSVTSSRQLQIRAGPTASTLACSFSGPPFKPTPVSGPTLCSTAASTVAHIHTSKIHSSYPFVLLLQTKSETPTFREQAGRRFSKWCVACLMLYFHNESCFPSFPTVGSVEIEPFYRLAVFKHISGSLAFFNYCFSTRLFCVNTSWQ